MKSFNCIIGNNRSNTDYLVTEKSKLFTLCPSKDREISPNALSMVATFFWGHGPLECPCRTFVISLENFCNLKTKKNALIMLS